MPKLVVKTNKKKSTGKKQGGQASIWDDIAHIIDDIIPLGMAPVALASIQRMTEPSFRQSGTKGIRIRHKEFVANIDAAAALTFERRSFGVNPGVKRSFPWLSGVAAGYQKYKFYRLAYAYVPQCPSSTAGSLMFGFNPDVNDAPPEDKGVLLRYEGATIGNLWAPTLMKAPVGNVMSSDYLYVRRGAYPAQSDPRLYDTGVTYVATEGIAAPTAAGSLYCMYDVELIIPTDPSVPSGTFKPQGTMSLTAPFGTLAPLVYGNVPWRLLDSSTLVLKEPFSGFFTCWADAAAGVSFTANWQDLASTATIVGLEGAMEAAASGLAFACFRVENGQVDETINLQLTGAGGTALTAVVLRVFEARVVDIPNP